MGGSNRSDRLASKQEQNREARLKGIRRWVEYIQEQPPEEWGAQQNRLINTRLESAREAGLPVDHEQRIRSFATSASERQSDEGSDS